MTEPTAPRPTLWHGCYTDSWQEVIVPEAFAHPAKFSRGLIHRIYRHLLAQGYIHQGQIVLDPFGGVALGALDAMTYGLSWVGIELEPRFVALGQQNLALWRRQYGFTGGVLLQGDSRQARAVLAGVEAGCVVGSPPYVNAKGTPSLCGWRKDAWGSDGRSITTRRGLTASYGTTPGQLGALPPGDLAAVVGSPPYAESLHQKDVHGIERAIASGKHSRRSIRNSGKHSQLNQPRHYGTTPGQLGALPPGDLAAVVGSPPFLDQGRTDTRPQGGMHEQVPRTRRGHAHNSPPGISFVGTTPGQLGALPPGDLAAIVGSPPYENTFNVCKQGASQPEREQVLGRPVAYGSSPSQLGNATSDTFWTAASAIVAECAGLLPVGAVAVWVVKDYIKNKKRVPFCDHWRQLCERHGFTLVEEIHASLVEDHGTQAGLFGGSETLTTERKSFFRRLAEKKGSPRIDHETVLILRKETPHE